MVAFPVGGQDVQSGPEFELSPWDVAHWDPNTNPDPALMNEPVIRQYLKVYTCPSDENPPPIDPGTWPGDNQSTWGVLTSHGSRSNYLFASYAATDYTDRYNPRLPPPGRGTSADGASGGMFGTNGAARLNDVKDGLSNSIAVGESKQRGSDVEGREGWHYGPRWGAGAHTCCHGIAYDPSWHINFPFPYRDAPNERRFQYAWGFGSWHPGGANFLFGDGHVRFLADEMDFFIFQGMNSIQGGERVDEEL